MIRTMLVCLSLLIGATAPQISTAQSPLLAELQLARAERAQGQFDAATNRLRALLRILPGDVVLREELALTLLLAKDYSAAQFHFEALDRTSPDPERRKLYKAALARIARERPSGLGFTFQIAPSTNVNSGSSEDRFSTSFGTLTINDDSQSQSGTRLHLGLNGFFRKPLENGDRVRLDWWINHTGYSGDAVSDRLHTGVTLSYRKESKNAATTFSFGRNFLHSDEDVARSVLGFNTTRRLTEKTLLSWGTTLIDVTNHDDPEDDGVDGSVHLRHIWTLERAQNVFLGARLERSVPGRAHNRFTGGHLQLGGQKVFEGGTVLSGSLSLGARNYDGIFPSLSFERHDKIEEIRINAYDSRLNWRGFTPRLNCSLRWVQSNVSLYESNTQECGVTLSRRF